MKSICIVSNNAPTYRKQLFQLLDKELACSFILGINNTSVRRMDTSLLRDCEEPVNHFIWGNIYLQPKTVKRTKGYDTLILDLGIFCITAWQILFLSKFRKQKVYLWDHGWYGREGFVKKLIKKIYFGLADGTLLYGNYAKKLMADNGFNSKKLHVIHNSLDYDRQILLRNTITPSAIYHTYFGNNYPVICFIGRLTSVKKLDQIIEAVAYLKKKGQNYNIAIIGDGPEKEKLVELSKKLNLKSETWFYGACYDEKTNAELIYNADLCVAPGNIGLTAMHAMMFGCPCISHNDFKWQMPEFESIVEGITGSFFKRDSVEELAESISQWINTNLEKREQIRNNCFMEIDNNWNPHKQVSIIQEVINE